ncbi:MAG TPA: MBL fold metallo-hydrolase, partial [Dehalococcoidia bacterium]|nr:MBL fold metallo-hydrolase [Dehalococcoidia bacterium]
MNVISFERTGLGNSSYLVDIGGGRAVAVDPDRTAQRYITAAEERGLRIVAALETHVHADFVSGARELAAAGADILAPAESELRFPYRGLHASERFILDGVQVEAIASPGHTPEHLSYVLRADGRAPALFSGGSLIVGGAARTDLITPEMTEPLTRAQFRTLHKAFGHLPDETELYPTHGGGSFCSVGGTSSSTSTLGEERRSNPLLAMDDEEEFVRSWPATFPAAPAYFFRMRAFNQAGPRLRRE